MFRAETLSVKEIGRRRPHFMQVTSPGAAAESTRVPVKQLSQYEMISTSAPFYHKAPRAPRPIPLPIATSWGKRI
jgi:hypothetical protein